MWLIHPTDNVEECITATQEKIIENEQRLEQLKTIQEEFNEDINKDLKKIQEQLVEVSVWVIYLLYK